MIDANGAYQLEGSNSAKILHMCIYSFNASFLKEMFPKELRGKSQLLVKIRAVLQCRKTSKIRIRCLLKILKFRLERYVKTLGLIGYKLSSNKK